ncbi:hypothetical protein ABZ438_07855 [Streptomyces sp. NPDC005786]|uniref:hypothetical protein n=1 Tax=Streptomyces sp. NPDC005786 TaxID=3154891 RepID=UPI0034027A61
MTQQQNEADAYPIHQARFRGGRVVHRVKKPADWHDLLHAKCGRSGYGASGYPTRRPRNCPGCYPAP